METFHIWTDGGCRIHGDKLGSWAYVIVRQSDEKLMCSSYGIYPNSTSNSMEMIAVIEGLKHALALGKAHIWVHTDSRFVVRGITEWINIWISKGWRKSNGKPVLNQPLWKELYLLTEAVNTNFVWVKGHSGNSWNELVHNLTQKAVMNYDSDNTLTRSTDIRYTIV